MVELKKGDKIRLTSGGFVTIEKELGRGGQGVVYLVDLNGEKKALKWYIKVPDDKFYKNLEQNQHFHSLVKSAVRTICRWQWSTI